MSSGDHTNAERDPCGPAGDQPPPAAGQPAPGGEGAALRQAIINSILDQLTRELDPDVIIRRAVQAIIRLGRWQSIGISLPTPDGLHWQTRAEDRMAPDEVGRFHPLHAGVVGRAYRTGEVQLVPDVGADPAFFLGEEVAHVGSELVIPIMFDGQVLGAINLESERRAAFDQDDIAFAQSIAQILAIALKNAERFAAIQQQIAEQRRTEQSLRHVLLNLEGAEAQAGLGSWSFDLRSGVGWWSRQMFGLFGLDPALGIPDNATYLALIHPDDRELLARTLDMLARGEPPPPIEFRINPVAGEPRVLSPRYRVERDASGAIVTFFGTVIDITERKRTEAALRSSEERYRQLFETMAQGVIYQAADGRIIDANPAAERILGMTRDQIAGRTSLDPHWQAVHEDGSPFPGEHHPAAVALRTGQPVRNVVMGVYSSTAGAQRWIAINATPIFNAGETTPSQVYTTFDDITERRVAERALQEERASLAQRVAERTADLSMANAELAHAVRVKDEFLATMSHELRTPLNSILGRAEAMQEGVYGAITPRQDASLRGIAESGQQLLSLINDILDFSRIEAGRLTLELETFDVAPVCAASVRMVQQEAIVHGITVTCTIDSKVTTIVADERRLKQILVNLLSNAVKFTPAGGRVGLEVRGDEELQTATFTVWDTGIGIAEQDLAKLFRPFVQIDSRLSRQYDGTGLGLALVLRLAEAHGGSVRVESAPGQGSRFSVTLPWAPAPEPPAPAAPEAPSSEPPAAMAWQLARALRDLGLRAELAPAGPGAAERVRAVRPDLIVFDALSADRAGWEALVTLRADPLLRTIPLVVAGDADEEARAAGIGAAAFLRKPVPRAALQRALRQATERAAEVPVHSALVLASHVVQPRVLLAEDSPANIEMLFEYLQARGYAVEVARNGFEAVAAALAGSVDIILMDIQMPGLDGLEATRQIRANPATRTVPIVALTALAMPGDRERCLEAGVDAYLAKPINMRTLNATLEALLVGRGAPAGAA